MKKNITTMAPLSTVAKFPPPTYINPMFMFIDYDELLAATLTSLTLVERERQM